MWISMRILIYKKSVHILCSKSKLYRWYAKISRIVHRIFILCIPNIICSIHLRPKRQMKLLLLLIVLLMNIPSVEASTIATNSSVDVDAVMTIGEYDDEANTTLADIAYTVYEQFAASLHGYSNEVEVDDAVADIAHTAYEQFVPTVAEDTTIAEEDTTIFDSNYDYEEETTAAALDLHHNSVYDSTYVQKYKMCKVLEASGIPLTLIKSKEPVDVSRLNALIKTVKRKMKELEPQRETTPGRIRQEQYLKNRTEERIGCALDQDISTVEKYSLGSMDTECIHCRALGFAAEDKGSDGKPCLGSLCCNHDKIRVPVANNFNLHPYIKKLFTSDTQEAKYFRSHSRMFGMGMAMASVASERGGGWGGRIGGRVSAIRVSGQLVRRIGPMMPRNGVKPKFMQTYFFEPNEATAYRMSNFNRLKPGEKMLVKRIFTKLHKALKEAGNTYINDCYAVKEYVEKNYPDGVEDFQISIHVSDKPSVEEDTVELKRTRSSTHRGRLNKPTVNEVSILFPNDATGNHERQVVFNLKQPADGGGVKHIRDDHRSYDPLSYPLFFNR